MGKSLGAAPPQKEKILAGHNDLLENSIKTQKILF